MDIDSLIKKLIQNNMLSEDDALFAIENQFEGLNRYNYDTFISLCKKHHIVDEAFFMKIYIKSSEDAQYKLWKDGYVTSCPAKRLIDDIASEDSEITKYIHREYEEELPHCKAYFENIQDVIVNHVSQARESLKIAMAWFTNPVIFNALWRACKRGVNVQLLINNDRINNRINGLPFDRLLEADAKLYVAEPPSLIHNKFCIIDDKIAIDGSYNWTILAETNNDENIVVIENGNVIRSFIDAFAVLIKNRRVDKMPDYVPDREDFDPCSYRYVNSEEYFKQVTDVGKKKQRELYKEIYKLLPIEVSEERIPSEIFEVVKKEVEDEKNHDTNLFNASINGMSEELYKTIDTNERKIETITRKVDSLIAKKAKKISDYKIKVEAIQSKRLSPEKKSARLLDLRKSHTADLNRINRNLAKHNTEINSLREESNSITEQQEFVSSLQDTELKGNNGLCRINLKWNTEDDLDLHLILPNGTIDTDNDIYYSHLKSEYNGGICSLDHDAIPKNAGENPQENIIWENKLPDGQYEVIVKLYSKKSTQNRIPFSITAFTGNYAKTGIFEFVNAKGKETIHVTTLTFKNGKVVKPISLNCKSIRTE